MAEKKASLTVLGGALAGTRFVLEGVGPEVLLGADPGCPFQLALPGVSPHHARVRIQGGTYTIEDAGSEQGLHVNDSRVDAATSLRNGDIVWLGTPGEADVVMLQCILPARPVAAAAPPAAPEAPLSDDETLALALEQSAATPPGAEVIEAEPATAFYTADEAAAASAAFAPAGSAPFVAGAGEGEVVAAGDETVAQSVPFVVDGATPGDPAPVHFEDDTREQTYVFEEESATVVMAGNDAPAAIYSGETGFMQGDPAAVVMAEEEPAPGLPPPPPPRPTPPPTADVPRMSPPPAAAPSAAPRPSRPATAATPSPAPRKPAPRPQPAPRAEGSGDAEPARSSPPIALYGGLGLLALAALGGAYFALGRTKADPPPPTLAAAPPVTAAPAPPRAEPAVPPVTEAPVPVAVEPEATPVPATAAVPAPPPTTLKAGATASPLPTPTPAAKKGAATPAPAATPAGPSPEQLRAQQVATLMGQAEGALGAGQYDQAVAHLDEVLRLEPGHAKAASDRASALALRDASRKKFVAGRTVVKTEKAAGGLAGFEGAEVQRQPDFSGRIEFEMSPASGLRPGDAWTLKYYLVNDGKKAIKVSGVTANTVVNGAGSGGAVASSVREVAPQARVLLGQSTGSWNDDTASWAADVMVTANRGDSLKNTLTWR